MKFQMKTNCSFCNRVRKTLRIEELIMGVKSSANSINVQIKEAQVAIAKGNDAVAAAKEIVLKHKETLANLQAKKKKGR